MLRRLRPAFYLLGVAVVVGSLLGARALTAGHGTDAKSANPAASPPAKVGGPIVLGTVDSKRPPVPYGLPPVMQSGTVAALFVEDSQEVKKDDKLYEFDTTIQKRDVERAKVAVLQARNEIAKAKEGEKQHAKKIAAMEQTVKAAKDKVTSAAELYRLLKANIEHGLKNTNPALTSDQLKEKLGNNADIFKVNIDYVDALNAQSRFEAELEILKAADVTLLVKQAEIALQQAEAEEAKAQSVVDLCTVRAKTDGVVEQVKISEGSTLGVSTRDPALWIIPAGPRVVRGEVEADFAHRVNKELIGKEVTILDHSDPKLTYTGVVKRIGGTFLPKRSADSPFSTDTKVIEVVVEVPDLPADDKRPPLRVGQRVRVNLGH